MELTKEARVEFLKNYLEYSEWFCNETGKNGVTASLMDFSEWLVGKVLDKKLDKAME